jgi:hypothetical protein
MRVFWLWFAVGMAVTLALTGCATTQTTPYTVCYPGVDRDGDNLFLCSPITRESIENNIKAPFMDEPR